MKLLSFLFTSSIGRKVLMAVTGLSLVAFLLVHAGINACIFFNDGGVTFNHAAEFMSHNWLIRSAEIGLFLGLLLHILQGLNLTAANRQKRNAKYGANAGNANSKWYSRSMGILGSLLLIFLVMHLKHFWVLSRFTDSIKETAGSTLFDEMLRVFVDPIPVVIYVIGCISLAYHLLHGFQSSWQSLGINHPAYNPIIQTIGIGFSIIVPLAFAAMPIAMHLGWIK